MNVNKLSRQGRDGDKRHHADRIYSYLLTYLLSLGSERNSCADDVLLIHCVSARKLHYAIECSDMFISLIHR